MAVSTGTRLEDHFSHARAREIRKKLRAQRAAKVKAEGKSPIAKVIRAGRLLEEGDPSVGKPVVGR